MKKSILIILILISNFAFGQFNDSVNYYIKLASTGVINKTPDASSYVLTNGGKFSISKESLKLNLNGSYVYGEQDQKLSNDDVAASTDFNFYQNNKFYYWGLGSYEKSYSLKINHKYQAGLGAAYTFFENPTGYLNVSEGVLYEYSDQIKDDMPDLYHTYRNSFRLMYRVSYKNIVSLDGMHLMQNSLEDFSDYIFKSANSFSFKLTTWLSLSAALSYNRVTRTGSENLLFTYGLTLEKFF